jgi:hypothetical protein
MPCSVTVPGTQSPAWWTVSWGAWWGQLDGPEEPVVALAPWSLGLGSALVSPDLVERLCSYSVRGLAGWLRPSGVKIVTWLILPVVICLSQRLSHACLSISNLYCETANGSLYQS